MKQYSFTDDDLRLAAASVCASMVNAVEAIPGGEHEYSDSFLEKMDALVALDKRRSKRRHVWHRVASVFLAFLLGASIFLATNPEARATFLAWVREVYENSVIYRFFGSESAVLPRYEITWMPEGFVLVDEQTIDSDELRFFYYIYGDDDFSFQYSQMFEGTATALYNPNGVPDAEVCDINGMKGYFYPADDFSSMNTLIWMDEARNVVLTINSTLEKSVILHIADSVILSYVTK